MNQPENGYFHWHMVKKIWLKKYFVTLLNCLALEWSCKISDKWFKSLERLDFAIALSFNIYKLCWMSLTNVTNIQQDPVTKHVWPADAQAAHNIPTYSTINIKRYPNGFFKSVGYLQLSQNNFNLNFIGNWKVIVLPNGIQELESVIS